jgi:hypothetical protein
MAYTRLAFAMLAAAACLAPSAAGADGFTVGNLLENCALEPSGAQQAREGEASEPKHTFTKLARHLACLAYIQGAMDMHVVTFGRMGRTARIYCAKKDVEVKAAALIVQKWVNKDPGRKRLPAALGLDEALREAFPCNAH